MAKGELSSHWEWPRVVAAEVYWGAYLSHTADSKAYESKMKLRLPGGGSSTLLHLMDFDFFLSKLV